MFSKKPLNEKNFYYYEYDFTINTETFIGSSQEERVYNDRYQIFECLKTVKKSNSFYDKNQVYFYISESESIGFKILYNYIKECGNIEILENEFLDDTTVNYKISCDMNNKKALQFLYWMIKTKDVKEISIYNYSIREILKSLDYNINITKSFNEKTIENYYDKQKIVRKLKEKYSITTDEDLVKKLASIYGKEQLLPTVGIDQNSQEYHDIFFEKADSTKYEELYSRLVNDGIIINRWKNERKLFKLEKTYFEDAIYQYHAEFLGKQSLDIFIPSLKIGIEYQGKQHYEAVESFGGEDNFKEQVERDNRKKKICKDNNIKLIEWGYFEDINKESLENKLKDIDILNIEYLKNKIGIDS